MAGQLHSIQSDKPGVVRYSLQGAPDETSPFELVSQPISSGNPIVNLYLKSSWTDTNNEKVDRLDRELKAQYQLMISALDNTDNELERSMLTVKVMDQNDEKPEFTQASRNLRCQENVSHNTVCGTIRADDKDEQGPIGYGTVEYKIPPNDEIWHSVSGQTEVKRTGMFAVDKKTGDVRLMNPDKDALWDREKYTKVEIIVQAYDSPNVQSMQHTVSATITIEILDVNDEQARFSSNCNFELSVDENQMTELYLKDQDYTFKGTDADATEENNLVFFEFEDERNNDIFHITNPGKNISLKYPY